MERGAKIEGRDDGKSERKEGREDRVDKDDKKQTLIFTEIA